MKFITTRVLSWEKLNAIREAKFIRSMYVWIFAVPVLAKLFQTVEDVVYLTVFRHVFEVHLSLPFSWQVFFWCAVSFGLANILALIFAPNIIKENKSYSDFQVAGKGEEHLGQYTSEIKALELYRPFSRERPAFESYAVMQDDYREHLRKTFWELYNEANQKRFRIRIVCTVCYTLGFSLLAWLLFSNIFWVVRFVLP